MARKFGRGIQRFRINLTLDRSELDMFENIFNEDTSDMAEHIKEQIRKAKQFVGEVQ